jgi:hypothetical protein
MADKQTMCALLSGETYRRDMPASDALLRSGRTCGSLIETLHASVGVFRPAPRYSHSRQDFLALGR